MVCDGTMIDFYGYSLRSTESTDLPMATEWLSALARGASRAIDPSRANFFIVNGNGRENVLVYKNAEPIAFYQAEHIHRANGIVPPMTDQARLHFMASPTASRKTLLRGITMLVPLIEKALALRGVRAIFFTSHSATMGHFMERRMGYHSAGRDDADGIIMARAIRK